MTQSSAYSQSGRLILSRTVFWIIAAFYAYGALVHVLNMLSLTGFDWGEAPAKWQALDIAYLILDVTVVVGLLRGARIGIWAFYCAACSQIALYTVLRDWVLDVPDAFERTPEEIAYLDTLVLFHVATIAILTALMWWARAERKTFR
jgi:hypothetical protein